MAKKTKDQKRKIKVTKKEKDRIRQSAERGKKLKSENLGLSKEKHKEVIFSIGPNATEEELNIAIGRVMRLVSRQQDVVDVANAEFLRLNELFNQLDQRARQFDGK